MAKMTLVVFKETGHVLGAVTRTTDPEGKLEAKELVGNGIPVRDPESGKDLLSVDPDKLDVKIVDLVPSVLLNPRAYVLVGDIPEFGEENTHATPISSADGVLTINLPSNVSEKTEAWIQVSGDASGTLVRPLDIASGTSTATKTLGLAPGNYAALLMVPGFEALATDFSAS